MRFPIPFAVPLLVALAAAQQPEPAAVEHDQDLRQLIAEVRAAHRGGRAEPLDRFRAALRFKSVAPDQDSIEIDITASFLAPRLLRYKVEDSSEVLERGYDERGAWRRIGDRVENVSSKDDAQERAAVRQQVGLARQLLGFLDPAKVIEGLEDVSTPGQEKLPVKRGEEVECDVVLGVAERFPMFAPPEGGPAEPRCGLKVWVDAATHRLVAVLVTPVDGEDRPIGVSEFLLLRDYTDHQDVAVARSMLVYRGVPWQKGQAAASVAIRAIDLDPDGLTVETLRRPG